MVIYWKRLFCGMNFFMISICDAEAQFIDSTNERYNLLIHHKELEQLTNICSWKTSAIKKHQILLSLRKKKNNKCDIYQDKVIDFTNQPSIWRSFVKNIFVDDDDIQLLTNRFDRNTNCAVSKGNFVYSFSFLRNWSIQSYSITYTYASLTS